MKNRIVLYAALAAVLQIPFCGYAVTQAKYLKKPTHFFKSMASTPQPTSCLTGAFTKTGDSNWYNIALQITNNCGSTVDFQNATITFNTMNSLNTNFWGNFSPLSYPDNNLQITSQSSSGSGFLASMLLHFPIASWANSKLPNGKSITILYGATSASYDPTSVKVYINGTPVQSGEIDLTNNTTQPSGTSQSYAPIDVSLAGQLITVMQVPWGGTVSLTGLVPGTYTISPENVTGSQGNPYQGTAVPNILTVNANQKVSSTITYNQIMLFGSINVQVPAIPSVLAGYQNSPAITFTRADTGASATSAVSWNGVTNVPQLANGVTYNFSTPVISFNGNRCAGNFSPASLVSSSTAPQTTTLSYTCKPIAQDSVTLNVSGLPAATTSINVTLTPNDGSTPVTVPVTIANGSGTGTVNLTDGVVYGVSSTSVSGYSSGFNPQPLTAASGATETINYQQQSGGRVMGYIPGWKTPPSASKLANAGYTHVFVAFALFSTTQPGQLVGAFDTVTQAYINSLHAAGIKVLISLGGASTSVAGTSVNFDQVLNMASSPTVFTQTFVQSLENMMTQYGFDGFDVDIEQGFNAGGTFTNPTGDIAVLASIINKVHADMPNALISLTPQVANISATSGFNATWGNYASLIMQTYNSLSWVQIQLYNAGCAYGLNEICYDPNATSSPDFSVAMAADLLENWPATTPSGSQTGFQPYISYLNPSQVVLGYPSVDINGNSDGSPATPTSTIKRAIQCLRTGTSCDTYIPPHNYPSIGGVFDWEVTYDQSNNFKFATDLDVCVKSGNCS